MAKCECRCPKLTGEGPVKVEAELALGRPRSSPRARGLEKPRCGALAGLDAMGAARAQPGLRVEAGVTAGPESRPRGALPWLHGPRLGRF